MSVPADYLKYPHRRYGMDHDRYPWSMLPLRKKIAWPGGARVAVWIVPALEWFPLDMKGRPFKPPGALQTAYPDLRHYTLRDYGNRVGIFRLMKALDRFRMRASVAVNAAVAARYPSLIKVCIDRSWEVIANGLDMDHLHYEGLPRDQETKLVEETLAILRRASGQKVRGWLSPARSESFITPDLVAAAGVDYICDWVNDDLPYAMRTESRSIHSMPLSNDIDDSTILIQNRHSEDSLAQQVCDQFDLLYKEAASGGGRMFTLLLHPWVIGQPYRISALERILKHITDHEEIWSATGGEILDAFTAQA